jgi:Ca-activated chloride channel homolog
MAMSDGTGWRAITRWLFSALPASPVVVALALGGFSAVAQDQPTFQASSSELVVLPVVVTGRNDAHVAGLTAERFTVYDNGKQQQISLFSNEDTPISAAIVIDDSGSMRSKIGQVLAATMAFARSSNPEDELFVIEFNDRVRDAMGDGAVAARDPLALEAALRTLKPTGQTALYDALLFGLERLERASRARKVIVLMSDGGDNASHARLDDVLVRARRSNVTIYAIGLFEPGAPDTNPDVLRKLAETTGGERYLPKSPGPLLAACERIAREIRSGYTLGYVPPHRDGAFHRVRVVIDGPDGQRMRVRTRPGYFAARSID